mgnify:CR=1 FL=1
MLHRAEARQAELVPGKTAGPQFYPVSAIDYCTGYLMAFGAMVALLGERRMSAGSFSGPELNAYAASRFSR